MIFYRRNKEIIFVTNMKKTGSCYAGLYYLRFLSNLFLREKLLFIFANSLMTFPRYEKYGRIPSFGKYA